jgi:predicted permease
MGTLLQDLRYGFRAHAKAPGFTLVAVLTLALGIGASTAVFSVVNAILLRPLPYPQSERIVLPWRMAPIGLFLGYDQFPWGQIDFHLFEQQQKSFQHLAAFEGGSFNLTGAGEPVLLEGMKASAAFFPALGVAPELGRAFTAEEDQPGHEHVVLLSHQLWHDRFGGNPAILGQSLTLSGIPYIVIGVMPASFTFPRAAEMPGSLDFPRESQLWIPLAIPASPPRGPAELAVVGRLKPGITIEQSQAELDVFADTLVKFFGAGKGWFNCRVTPLARQVGGETRRPLLLVLGAVGVVLLIACSNVANLLLTRSLARRREFTLRAALGADRSRLIRQLLTESLLLAAAGGALGLLIAEAGITFVKAFGPANIPRLREVSLDPAVFGFTLAVTLLTGILFGLVPALAAGRENLVESLKEGGQRAGASPASQGIRNSLLVSQVALALVLVIAAGLLVRTFYQMLGSDSGFNPTRVLAFEMSLPSSKYKDGGEMVRLYQRALQQLQTVPGVQAAGVGETIPMRGAGESTSIRLSDRPRVRAEQAPFAAYTMISSGYFPAVGTPVLRGRGLLETDTLDSMPVTVINAAMARKYWPGHDALGKQVAPASLQYPLATIVGIVADAKHLSLREEPGPEMYVPFNQKVWPSLANMQVAVRTKADPALMTGLIRDAIHSVDPDLPLGKLATLNTLVDDAMTRPRFSMLLMAAFGGLAVALAGIGMYGVIAYSVAQRTREIGIRMALGAQRSAVFTMVLQQGAKLAGVGIAIGLLAAIGVTRLMAAFLYGVQPTDPLTFSAVSLLLAGIVLLACYLPARRATRVDPIIALRDE